MLKLVLAKTDSWWNKLTNPQQEKYIEQHPNSKYAKEKKALEEEQKKNKSTEEVPESTNKEAKETENKSSKSGGWFGGLKEHQLEKYLKNHPNSKKAKEALEKLTGGNKVSEEPVKTENTAPPAEKPKKSWFDTLKPHQLEKYIKKHPNSKVAKEYQAKMQGDDKVKEEVPETKKAPAKTKPATDTNKAPVKKAEPVNKEELIKQLEQNYANKVKQYNDLTSAIIQQNAGNMTYQAMKALPEVMQAEKDYQEALDALKIAKGLKKPPKAKPVPAKPKPISYAGYTPEEKTQLQEIDKQITAVRAEQDAMYDKASALYQKFREISKSSSSTQQQKDQAYAEYDAVRKESKKYEAQLKELARKRSEVITKYDPEYAKKKDYWQSIASQPSATKLNYAAQPKKLTNDEVKALRYYTGSGYQKLNGDLRKGNTSSDYVKRLDKVFANAGPTTADLVTSRGVKTRKFLENLELGSILSDKGYTSTSTASGFSAGQEGAKLTIVIPKGSKNAVAVNGYSVYPAEHEVLINRDAKMKVVAINKRSEPWEITLELVND